jgi:tetratricopeptide (TPR) repeat protein
MSHEQYVEQLRGLRAAGKWREALALSNRTYERHRRPAALVHVCEILLQMRDFAGFAANVQSLRDLAPNLAEIDRLQALRADADGDLNAALGFWLAYSAKEPAKPAPAFRIAQILIETRRYLRFEACRAELAERFPDHSKLRHVEYQWERVLRSESRDGVRGRALASTQSRRWVEALGDWEFLCVADPADPHSFLRVCDCPLEMKTPREAWEVLRGRISRFQSAKRFPQVFSRMIGLLAGHPEPLHEVIGEADLEAWGRRQGNRICVTEVLALGVVIDSEASS